MGSVTVNISSTDMSANFFDYNDEMVIVGSLPPEQLPNAPVVILECRNHNQVTALAGHLARFSHMLWFNLYMAADDKWCIQVSASDLFNKGGHVYGAPVTWET